MGFSTFLKSMTVGVRGGFEFVSALVEAFVGLRR